MSSNGRKLYIGELGNDGNQSEIESAFSYYGPVRSVWVARNPPGFAFVEFDDPRDAEDAIEGLDGRSLCGHRVKVEMAGGSDKGRGGRGGGGGWSQSRGRAFDPNDRCYECGERGHYAYDCRYRRQQTDSRRGGRYRRSRSSSRGRRSRTRSYTRSRSPERRARSPRRSRSPRRNGRD